MSAPKPKPETADGKPVPSKLKLAFSKAADNARISVMFDPAVKLKIDPKNYVVKREKAIFDHTISQGHAAFLYDTARGDVHTLSMAYQIEDKAANDPHKHTEIGTSITRLAGYKSAQLVIAALVLKEWWDCPPQAGLIVTEILPDNGPSLKAYRDHLGWEPVKDEQTAKELHDLCNENIAAEDKGRPTIWFACTNAVLPKLAAILLQHMDSPALHNKYTGSSIDLDLSALDKIGLTRARLEAISKGITDRSRIEKMQSAPPPGLKR
ncbi:MAG: hypothetical protein H6867_04350 [Rhodospirillales bacterium]|nr:hypothetical protein [Rhodospirillales bacterium]MCB9996381.1 hypothetical protein [Rhodospirillales bacterium]